MPRTIPEGVARLLRQEAGFGCCVCGNPILQYHHIVEWAVDQHFRVEDMMVLCPLHHDQATKGAMPITEQRAYKLQPFNILHGHPKGLLAVRQNYCAANFGTIVVVGEGPFLKINKENILSLNIGVGNLEVSLKLFDQQDQLILEIDRNEWVVGDPLPWDIEADWQKLTIRERARKISFSLDGKSIPLEIRGEFWRDGKKFSIDQDGIAMSSRELAGISVRNLALVATILEIDEGKFSINTTSTGMIISWPDRRERLWKAKEAWEKIKRERDSITN